MDDGHVAAREKLVALHGRLAEPGADGEDQVGLPRPRHQGRVGADAEVADEVRQPAVIQRLAPETHGDRQALPHQEVPRRRPARVGPAASAQDRQRLAAPGQHRLHFRQRRRVGQPGGHGRAADVGNGDAVLLHFLRQRDHHRAGPPGGGNVHGVGHQLRDAAGVVDLRDPFGERAEHAAVINLLEAVAVGFLERDLADEQQQRRAVLLGHVHADGAVTGARAARHHGGGGTSGELAVGFGHVDRARLEPAGEKAQAVLHIV